MSLGGFTIRILEAFRSSGRIKERISYTIWFVQAGFHFYRSRHCLYGGYYADCGVFTGYYSGKADVSGGILIVFYPAATVGVMLGNRMRWIKSDIILVRKLLRFHYHHGYRYPVSGRIKVKNLPCTHSMRGPQYSTIKIVHRNFGLKNNMSWNIFSDRTAGYQATAEHLCLSFIQEDRINRY